MTFDLRRAQSLVDSIPEIKESIPYLTQLANGANPEIPGYLALGKIQQITSMAQGTGANKPPQGTIKDKLTQTGGVMSLMGGRGAQAAQQSQMMGMQSPGPAPEGIPEPEVQPSAPDEMMGMSDGGITSAEIDPRMFNFDGGGIVAFAKKGAVEEKEETTAEKLERQRKEDQGAVMNFIKELGSSAMDIAALPVRGVAGAVDTALIRPARAMGADVGYLAPRLVPEGVDPESMTPFYDKIVRGAGSKPAEPVVSPEEMRRRNEQNRLRASHEAAYRAGTSSDSPYPGTPIISPEMQKMLNMNQPAPPPGGINDGKVPVPGANVNIGAAKPQALPENEFLTMARQALLEKPEVFDEAKEAEKIRARNEAAGIGTYAKTMRDQQQQMRDKFAASRPDQFEQLLGLGRAFSRVGARAGDVGAEGASQMRNEREAAFQFEQDQFKITEAIEKLEEARRTGDVDKIAKAEEAVRKANADKRNHQMTLMGTAANTLGRAQEGAAERAQNLAIETAKLNLKKAELAQGAKDSETIKIMKEVEALQAAGKIKEADAKLDILARISAAKQGVKYTGAPEKKRDFEHEKFIQDTLQKRLGLLYLKQQSGKLKPEEAARIKEIEAQVRAQYPTPGGGGGGEGGITAAQRAAAEQWLKNNPNDPRAAEIRQRLAGG